MKNILCVLVVAIILEYGSAKQGQENDCGCLLLSPYIKQGPAGAMLARNLSQVDSKPFLGIKSHSGFINVNEKYDSTHFFWFFPVENLETAPWIIWLGGGPGVTALKGLFDVIGPLMIKDGQVKLRNITWASDYSLLFLDVPVGAGFSYTKSDEGYPDNEDDVGAQMLEFLVQFLKVFPELRKAPLFITGQSYAGKYVPALAIQIHKNLTDSNDINLRGIAMGNGMVDPRNMMQYSQLCTVLGILDDTDIEKLKTLEQAAVSLTDEGRMIDAANKFNETIEFIKKQSGVNIYNFNQDVPAKGAPAFETYLHRPDVRNHLHVGNVTFNFNNQHVYSKMLPDIMNSSKPFVEELLERYGVMSYSGQLDIILAYSLSRNVFKTLDWSQRSDYVDAPSKRIRDEDGKIVAYSKSGGNLVDVVIRDAGHNAPSDQPEVSKYIIDTFIEEFR